VRVMGYELSVTHHADPDAQRRIFQHQVRSIGRHNAASVCWPGRSIASDRRMRTVKRGGGGHGLAGFESSRRRFQIGGDGADHLVEAQAGSIRSPQSVIGWTRHAPQRPQVVTPALIEGVASDLNL